ncbi:MAG: transcription factor S [Candidatus Aenigmatarchaeota archaeon]
MEFCPKCNSIMVPKKGEDETVLTCRNCGHTEKSEKKEFKVKQKIEENPMDDVIVVDKDKDVKALPKTNKKCPECGHGEVYWWTQQTRSADEAPTRFFQCTKCEHKWREYD